MKKIVLLFLIALAAIPGMSAQSQLKQTFDKICQLTTGRILPDDSTRQLLFNNQSRMTFDEAHIWYMELNRTPQQMKSDFAKVAEIASDIPDELMKICVRNDYNQFSFYVGDKVSKDTREVLILWSPGFYNHRCVIYGAMKKEDISRLQMGNISVDFFNTSITPAPEKEYKVAKELLKVADL